jgi:hypothetical protein
MKVRDEVKEIQPKERKMQLSEGSEVEWERGKTRESSGMGEEETRDRGVPHGREDFFLASIRCSMLRCPPLACRLPEVGQIHVHVTGAGKNAGEKLETRINAAGNHEPCILSSRSAPLMGLEYGISSAISSTP